METGRQDRDIMTEILTSVIKGELRFHKSQL